MSCPLCATLRAERDEAIERARQFKARANGSDDDLGRLVRFGLPRGEALIATLLLARQVASNDALLTALYGDREDGGGPPNTPKVLIHRLRRRLAGYGVRIATARGVGYSMDADSKTKLRAVLAT